MNEIKLASSIDESVNFVTPSNDGGFYEARYVRRSFEEIICYLSTQTGCNQGCRMCHLTQTKQTSASDAYVADILDQARKVFEHYNKNCKSADTVNYNFMARGEPLNSIIIKEESEWLFSRLGKLALDNGLLPRFKVSTIMPKSLDKSLKEIFPVIHPDIYYSAYSYDEKVRQRWLPNAMPIEEAIRLLKEWQDHTHKIVRIHYAVIKGVNDDNWSVQMLYNAFSRACLAYDVNLVYYNPYNDKFGEEGSMAIVENAWRSRSIKTNIVDRVGFDVHASCGMFYASS
jgi:23S rRNA (adenine2503-C2)-methyltransferase